MADTPFQPLPAIFLIRRGYCCGLGCRNCPYVGPSGERHVARSTTLAEEYQHLQHEQGRKNG